MTEETKLILEKLDKMDTRITNLETSMNAKFESIDARFTSIDAKLESIDAKFESIDARFTSIDAKFESIDARFTSIDAKFDSVDARFTSIETELVSMDAKITDLRLTLENETNRNIKLIAEGHLDLSRKLDEALKIENEKEMLLIRMNTAENEIRKINSKLEDIA